MIGNKENLNGGEFREIELKNKKRRNKINRFLNSYFKFIVLFFVIAFLFLSLLFVIKPKLDNVLFLSDSILRERKIQFIKEYNNLQNYQNVISEFSEIGSDDIYRINKMVPSPYSRDELFAYITYFLIDAGFRIESVDIVDGQGGLPLIDLDSSATSRRRDNATVPADGKYSEFTRNLPNEVGFWVVDIKISDINYQSLKKMLGALENNLKLMDVFYLDFYPENNSVDIGILTYFYKN